MRMKHSHRKLAALLGAMIVTAPLALAQEQAATPPPAEQPPKVVKVLRVREGASESVADLIRNFRVDVRTTHSLDLITVAGEPDEVAKAEQAVHEIELLTAQQPTSTAQGVEVTAHFLGIVDEDLAPPAGSLHDVIAELKKTFPFQGYKLLETIAVRSRVREISAIEGLLPEPPSEGIPPKKYDFQCRVAAIEPRQNTQLVRFDFVRATIRLPIVNGANLTYENVRISTGMEIPDGKTVVVGKAGATGASQGYMLVLTAKVVK